MESWSSLKMKGCINEAGRRGSINGNKREERIDVGIEMTRGNET